MRIGFYLGIAITTGLLAATTVPSMTLGDEPPSQGPPSQGDDRPPPIRLSIHPAGEPRPALRYRLLPTLIDLRPGNAAVFYNKAALMWQQQADAKNDAQRASEWADMPLDKLPRAEMAVVVSRWGSVLQEVELATLREECDWQMPVRERIPYSIMLPELQELRNIARLLAAKARLGIAEGRYDDAVASLRMGYAVARHAARGPTLIHALVGIAIANIMTNQIRELSQQPDAPNLYWAFAVLPRPFIDLDRAYDYEADSIYFWHPEWREMEREGRGPAEWRRAYDQLVDAMNEIDTRESSQEHRVAVLIRAIKDYSRAKQWLVDYGRSPEAVELMTVQQVVVLYTFGTYNDLRDQMFKWSRLPYREVHEQLAAAERFHEQSARRREIVPLAHWLLPAIQAAMHAQTRNEQVFALSRTIEALRLYAAGHDGRLPKQLADITEAPVPDDPATGGPFTYRLSGDTAVLEGTLPPGLHVRYEITVAR
ncbi:MAG TPA: hypothetical protein VNH11_22195 [Pirellulales bacterium]|nr:hypothetical protein [Pirellulales bacterium]